MSNIWVLITSNEKIIYAQKSREKKKKKASALFKTGKEQFCPYQRGIVCQGKYLGGALKMVNLFLHETVMRKLLNGFLGKKTSVIITALESGQVPKPDAFDLKCREGLVS